MSKHCQSGSGDHKTPKMVARRVKMRGNNTENSLKHEFHSMWGEHCQSLLHSDWLKSWQSDSWSWFLHKLKLYLCVLLLMIKINHYECTRIKTVIVNIEMFKYVLKKSFDFVLRKIQTIRAHMCLRMTSLRYYKMKLLHQVQKLFN